MKANEVRAKSFEELNTELGALLKEQFNLKIQKGLGEVPKSHGFKNVRRQIARIKTIMCEKVKEGRKS